MAPSRSTTDHIRVLLVGRNDRTESLRTLLESRSPAVRLSVAASAEAALDRLAADPVHCILTAHALPDATGLDLTRAVRDDYPDVPVVLCPEDGDEALASDAIAAGVADYLPADIPGGGEAVAERVDRAVEAARRSATNRERARRFDAIFRDSRTYTWVLETDGTVARASRPGTESAERDAESNGTPFWELSGWAGADESRERVRDAIESAANGDTVQREVTWAARAGDRRTLDVTVRPVRDEGGEVTSLLADGSDITERATLEAELRESEELHRVTLNNMTDTVLITNDAGEFTYVCPNVHFIFGYTAEEIRELGTIDELLGRGLFDRDELASEGVLTNIECAATDKAGGEHTLLVNVRQVSIQGGSTLYSCRDITTRTQREEALAALHRTTRELLYTETKREIGRVVVEDAADVLGLDASAVLLFDTDENVLRPTAASREMESLNGPLPTLGAGEDSIAGHAFVEGEARFFDDVHDSDRLANPATGVRSGAFVPLGDHGVFVAGSAAVGEFDDVSRELTDLLAATTEAALDRVARESTLRTQDRELQRRNRQLTRLNRMNEIIREIDQAVVQAETRAEIERAVCANLTKADRFRFAWIGAVDPTTDELRPRAWVGEERGYLDSISVGAGEDATEPAGRTARTREVTVVSNVAENLREEPWRKAALSREYQSAVSVPLAYDEFVYGVLTVYADAPSAFDELSRSVVAELGETVASAISAVERKNALLTTSSTRLEFEVGDPGFVLLRLANEADCALLFDGGVQQTSEGVYVFASVEGASPEAVAAAARETVSIADAQVISGDDDSGTVRLRLSQPFIALHLAAHGAVLRSASADGGAARMTVDVPSSVDARSVHQIVSNAFSDVALVSKQGLDRSSARESYGEFFDRLTERQLEVIQVAYYGGFFESPRESTGEEIAETLGISPPAFYRHNRTVQRKLFSVLFDEIGVRPDAAREVE